MTPELEAFIKPLLMTSADLLVIFFVNVYFPAIKSLVVISRLLATIPATLTRAVFPKTMPFGFIKKT